MTSTQVRFRIAEASLVCIFLFVCCYFWPQQVERSRILERALILSNTIDGLDDAIITVDRNSKIVVFSKGASRLLKVDEETVTAKEYFWVLDETVYDMHVRMMLNKEWPIDGKTRVVDCAVRRYDGTKFWGRIYLQAVSLGPNHGQGFAVQIHELGTSIILPTPKYPQTPPIIPQPLIKKDS